LQDVACTVVLLMTAPYLQDVVHLLVPLTAATRRPITNVENVDRICGNQNEDDDRSD
jgi:hypothetical protein